MEIIKADSNTEFDVLYSDGSKAHVREGLLLECKGNKMILHFGTNRSSVLFDAVEALFEVIHMLGLQDLFEKYFGIPAEGGCPDG